MKKSILSLLAVGAVAVAGNVWASPTVPQTLYNTVSWDDPINNPGDLPMADGTLGAWSGGDAHWVGQTIAFTVPNGWGGTYDVITGPNFFYLQMANGIDPAPDPLLNEPWVGNFNIPANLLVTLTGDGLYGDGTQAAAYFMAAGGTLMYYHELQAGLNTIPFTQNAWTDYYMAGDWATDIANVTTFGIALYGDVVDGNAYTLLQYDLAPMGVPEPETVWMMVAVLASLGVTFRRQLMGMFAKA